MGITKTDFVRGMQCPKMLWLDRHKPELKEIPLEVQKKLDLGNEFGDRMMGMFGPYTEVQEYYPGTKWPDKPRMAAKTAELIAVGTKVICEAAFMDDLGNYCAVDILRWDENRYCYDMYEVKNAVEVSDRFVQDAAFQAYLIRKTGLCLKRVFIVYHSEEPYDIKEVTTDVQKYASWVDENIDRLGQIKEQSEEVQSKMGIHCSCPYECWYYGYCHNMKHKNK